MVLIIRFKSITYRPNKTVNAFGDLGRIRTRIESIDNLAKAVGEVIEMLVLGIRHLLKYITKRVSKRWLWRNVLLGGTIFCCRIP
jgi:hypothetical protein